MKRRILLSVLTLALVLLAMPVMAAQDSKSVWDLTENLKFTDLGFNVTYPAGWVYSATEGSGVFFAEDKADLTAVTDDDTSTLGEKSTFQLVATEIANLKDAIGDDPSLETLADFLVQSRGITEKEQRIEIPVLSRRTLTILGVDGAN